MTEEQLIAEGEMLAKTCFLLTEEPQESGVVGYWGGDGRPDIPLEFPSFVTAFSERRHWITVNAEIFKILGARALDPLAAGTLSIYEDERVEGGSVGTVFHDSKMVFRDLEMDGVPLYAKPSQSFPPLTAVCLYGGDAVLSWMKSQGLQRHDYDWTQNDKYREVWQQRCPLFTDECAAVVGGWHTTWPEDDFYMPPEMKLLIWTFKDAEPYLELWRSPLNFKVMFRTT